jgi:hypothetical protein
MSGQRVWRLIRDLGKRVGVDTIHRMRSATRAVSNGSNVPVATSVRSPPTRDGNPHSLSLCP